jgi:serine/threonine protein kinase
MAELRLEEPNAWLAGRFRVSTCLGQGATGVVYRAFDTARGAEVAVKLLTRLDHSALFRFKSEFRELADLHHPHLLTLYDLVAHERTWVLSMQLIEGCDFLAYVRPNGEGQAANDNTSHAADAFATATLHGSTPDTTTLAEAAPPRVLGPLELGRLRSALLGLCEGLDALHRTGRLHRDLKPANVLVSQADGRVVLCDFGLVVASDEGAARSSAPASQSIPALFTTDGAIVGTLAYMAPEQALGRELSTASDWYAVGVMLYEALTGALPWQVSGSFTEILERRTAAEVCDPRTLDPSLPPDLCELAVDLLRRAPAARPDYATLRQRLAPEDARHATPASMPRTRSKVSLIGRDAELSALRAAYAQAAAGMASVVFVSGRSGMGKSALVRAFLTESRAEQQVTVLGARCYEREHIPFKALDPWVDALASHLLDLSELALSSLIPEDIDALLPLFPALERVPAIQVAALRAPPQPERDALERREHAFRVLRELLKRVARNSPLVIFIDDLQWGDEESGQAFAEILRNPGAPPLLLVLAHRAEEEAQGGLLTALRERILPACGLSSLRTVEVGSLSRAHAQELARSLLRGHDRAETLSAHIAQEAEGSPFFVGELCAYVRARPNATEAALKLEAVLRARLEVLPSDSARLLSVIAAAGRPERRDVLLAAAGLTGQHDAERVLIAESFVQSNGQHASDRLEPYHDRIREAAYGLLAPEQQRSVHSDLARALIEAGETDAERLYAHHRAAGEHSAAFCQAIAAADRAEQALAFDRAAQLIEEALGFGLAAGEQRRALVERRGNALMFAGKGPEAAESLFEAAEGAPAERRTALRCLGIAQLFRAGLLDRGYAEIERARDVLRLPTPRSFARALWMLLSRRLRIALRRSIPKNMAQRKPTAEDCERLDLLWGIASCLIVIDPLRGAVYQAEHMLLARRVGDYYRLARALCLDVGFYAADNRAPAKTLWVLDRANEMAGASQDLHALSVAKGTACSSRMLEGRLREAVRLAREAQAVNTRFRALVWDKSIIEYFELNSIALLGHVGEIMERIPAFLRDADRRGDSFGGVAGRVNHFCFAWLGHDRPDLALREVEEAERLWKQQDYGFLTLSMTIARAEIGLYEDTVDAAAVRLDAEWKEGAMVRSLTQFSRGEALFLRGRLALAKAAHGAPETMLARAKRDARDLEREGVPWLVAQARLIAGAALAFSDAAAAAIQLGEAEGRFEAVDMLLAAAACRVRRGQLTPGPRGAALVAQGLASIRGLGAQNPAKFVRLMAPGFPAVLHPIGESAQEEAAAPLPFGR